MSKRSGVKWVMGVIAVALLLTVGVLGYAGLGYNVPGITRVAVPHDQLEVVTSFYPLYYFASVVGGPQTHVVNITPAGAEPHEYEPTARDIVTLQKADLVVLNGLGLEPWATGIELSASSTLVAGSVRGVSLQKVGLATDPHIWLSPKNTVKIITAIAVRLATIDPPHAAEYMTRAYDLLEELHMIDEEYELGLANCATRDMVTSHAAFGYLAHDYKLTQVAIAGISPDEEPGPRALAQVVETARNHNAKYIFFESLVSSKLAQTIASEVGAQTLVLNPLEGLTAQELTQGKTYLSEMRNNLHNLQQGLSCY